MTWDVAQRVADAVLYEGYLLYPYRASSVKNQVRWQFGVLMPRDFAESDGSERWQMRTECLLRTDADATIDVRVRFLRLQGRTLEVASENGWVAADTLEVDGEQMLAWEEAVEATIDVDGLRLADLLETARTEPIELGGGRDTEDVPDADGVSRGRVIRTRWPVHGSVTIRAEDIGDGLVRLRTDIENTGPGQSTRGGRDLALRGAMLGVHGLFATRSGTFVSLLEPPAEAAAVAAGCVNEGAWPVLVGEEGRVVLASPIILYDQPSIAPESPGDLFDATEIDEILTLRIMTLTDDEKREARATDPRARRIIERSDAMPPEMLERLHGAIRQVHPAGDVPAPPPAPPPAPASPFSDPFSPDAPFWEPEARVDPHTATVEVDGRAIGRGATVRLNPGPRGDSMDMFLRGRLGRIEGVWETLEEEPYVAITLVDDPASEEHALVGRYLYFRPNELEAADELAEAGR